MKLNGYEEIAMHIAKHHTGKCSERTARRYAERWGLPVERLGDGPVFTDTEAVDAWVASRRRQRGRAVKMQSAAVR